MNNRLLELNGIDNPNDYSFKWKIENSFDGYIDLKNKKILGAHISKDIVSSKIINSFEDINVEGFEIFGNIFIANVLFNISIEYCEDISYGKINLLNKSFYKTFLGSLKNFNFDTMDTEILVTDFELIPYEDKLYYFIETLILISEM